ncbi:MAG TPA: TetR/AcrR family transcriptional regulator [Roseiflexaceae bacterium]|nr:TetR/AcrR family transcriptional regulator [Roseiflexaceae bacterium]
MGGSTDGRRGRRDAQRNLERVLRAARELFAERGAEVTMEEVARRAGVGVGTIYRRFPSKEQLFAAVSSAACADARHSLQAAAQAAPDPLAKLRALVAVQYRRSQHLAALIDMRPADPANCHQLHESEELYEALHALLAQVIAEGQRSGDIRPGEPGVLAAICLELLSPRAFQHVARVAGAPEDVPERMVEFVLHGLSGNR